MAPYSQAKSWIAIEELVSSTRLKRKGRKKASQVIHVRMPFHLDWKKESKGYVAVWKVDGTHLGLPFLSLSFIAIIQRNI